MVYDIYTGTDNPTLRKKSAPVTSINKSIKKLVKDMEETLIAAGNAVGLAAPQVGVHLRVMLITLFKGSNYENGKVLPMINPKIIKHSVETVVMEEGCLSIPGYYREVERPASVVVEFQDVRGKLHTLSLSGMNAREVQHELDHLEGILFTDYLEDEVILRMPEVDENGELQMEI